MTDLDKRRRVLGDALRKMRAQAGYLTGKDVAAALDWQQSRVSRIENGNQTPTDSDVIAWCEACGASESVTSSLLDQLRELRIESASWRRQLRTGHTPRQTAAGKVEHKSQWIRAFEFAVLPGLVQTPDYARHVLQTHARTHNAPMDVDRAIRERMSRQQIIYDSQRSIELVITEAALRFPVCPADVIAAQLDRLLTVCGLSTVRFGIIPSGTLMPVVTMNGFWIFDDESVVIETIDSEITAEDPNDVRLYHRVMDELWTVAAEGGAAREVLLSISDEYAGNPVEPQT